MAQRNLLQASATDQQNGYVLRENRLANKNFKGNSGYRSILRSRLGDDADYINQDEDDDDDDDDDDDNDDDEEEEEEGDDDENFAEDDEYEEDEENNDDETVTESEPAFYSSYG